MKKAFKKYVVGGLGEKADTTELGPKHQGENTVVQMNIVAQMTNQNTPKYKVV